MVLKRCIFLSLLVSALSLASYAYAEEDESSAEGEGPAIMQRPIYVPVKPAFVVNYGRPGKLKYLKLDVSLRVKDTASSNAIRHHMPLIRDYLVREFSRIEDEDIDSQEGKEAVRIAALAGVKALLLEEDGEEGVTDLFFNNFVVQR
ncbi:MAG: flagellar basal body-associated FliL family protein [Cellvibrionaceae bacterium]|nr:flagellar basal body-associated FliL family protein [Cellvibrionaceae bacterium]